jgi:hypothetical protein
LFPIAIEICLLPVFAKLWGLPAVACLVCVAYASQWIVYGPFLKRELSLGIKELSRLAFPIFLSAAAGIFLEKIIYFPHPLSWFALAARGGIVCLAFAVTHELLTGGAMMAEFRPVFLRRLQRFTSAKPCAVPPAQITQV